MFAKRQAAELRRARDAGVRVEGEDANTWHERFLASPVGKVGNIEDARGRWRKWIAPTIGTRPMGGDHP